MKSITPLELQNKISKTPKEFLLIDVREDFEHEHFNIGGLLMPMGTVYSKSNIYLQISL